MSFNIPRNRSVLIMLALLAFCGEPVVAAKECKPFVMPVRGVCAHRGASRRCPENTIPALAEAVRLGAHMIEFDLILSGDGHVVLMHDSTVDRTTNGHGKVSDLTLAELRKLDAGSWKNPRFKGTKIPTFSEALSVLPKNIWLNVHLKGGSELAEKATKIIVDSNRIHQAFLACSKDSARAARQIDSRILICNMDRQSNSMGYVNDTIQAKCDFIQLTGEKRLKADLKKTLKDNHVRINFFGTNDPNELKQLFQDGVEFPLVDDVTGLMPIATGLGIEPLKPIYQTTDPILGISSEHVQLVESRSLGKGRATQGVAIGPDSFYSSSSNQLFRYDKNWQLQKSRIIKLEGVNHIGAIDYHDRAIWAGFLHGPENGKHDPKLNRSVIAKIDANTFDVTQTWDITNDVTWVDPVCVDGSFLYVGDLSDLGIHRYRIATDKLTRAGVFRYPKSLHFSQGIRISNGKLYSMHTFGKSDGLFEFEIPAQLNNDVQKPTRFWPIPESRTHLEGFEFCSDKPDCIWHAQGQLVDLLRLWTDNNCHK